MELYFVYFLESMHQKIVESVKTSVASPKTKVFIFDMVIKIYAYMYFPEPSISG